MSRPAGHIQNVHGGFALEPFGVLESPDNELDTTATPMNIGN